MSNGEWSGGSSGGGGPGSSWDEVIESIEADPVIIPDTEPPTDSEPTKKSNWGWALIAAAVLLMWRK